MLSSVICVVSMSGAVKSSVEMSVIGRFACPMSGLKRSALGVLLFLASARPKVFKTCQAASEALQMTVDIAGVNEILNCSTEDVARLVCIASLHNFNTSYAFKMDNNDTALGIFGIPSKYTQYCGDLSKTNKFQDHFDCLARSQFKRNGRNQTQPFISEIICNEAELSLKDYYRILEVWNISHTVNEKPNWFYKRRVTCKNLELDYLYVTKEDLRRIYRPGVLDGAGSAKNETEDNVSAFEQCREMSYCMNACRKSDENSDDPTENRKYKGRMERKVERFGRIVDQAIIVFWIIAVVAALVAAYIFVRNPRHRGVRQDDWSRPILTAHFSEQ